MINYSVLIAAYVVMAVFGKVLLSRAPGIKTRAVFTAVNCFVVYLVFFAGLGGSKELDTIFSDLIDWQNFKPFFILMSLVVLFYFPLTALSKRRGVLYFLAFLIPMLYLAVVKTIGTWNFLGVSYISFRLAFLSFQINSRAIKEINIIDYLGFTFFFASFLVGPITKYSDYDQTVVKRDVITAPLEDVVARFALGILKFTFLAQIANQFSFTGLMLDGHLHYWYEYMVCSVGFLLYVYFNFSGLTDLTVASSGFYGVKVKENFERPFIQTNIQGFWDHWHMSLSHFVRDCIYSPLAFFFARNVRVVPLPIVALFSVIISFSVIGLWHGIEWRFLFYGLANALGVIIFTLWKRFNITLPKPAAVGITILFIAVCASLVEISPSKYDLIFNTIIQ